MTETGGKGKYCQMLLTLVLELIFKKKIIYFQKKKLVKLYMLNMTSS